MFMVFFFYEEVRCQSKQSRWTKKKKRKKKQKLYNVGIRSCFDCRKLYRLDMQLKSFDEWEGFNVNLRDLVERYDVSSREWKKSGLIKISLAL